MEKINKDFDGVSWEWKGKTVIRDLKAICPNCKYELDIKMTELKVTKDELPKNGLCHLHITTPEPSYFCPKCSFSANTTINGVDSPEALRKVVLKEFEHRQRLKASESPTE